MAILSTKFIFTKKIQLTHDVYELVFEAQTPLLFTPGQYVLFSLPSWLKRAYSVASAHWSEFRFIIKKLEQGGGGSKEICSLPVGSEISGMWPIGHFLLKSEDVPSCFIGTWTGFAPLYAMIQTLIERKSSEKIHFIFGVREQRDLFYQGIFEEIAAKNRNFTYELYLSRESKEGLKRGYVTDALSDRGLTQFTNFYLCGSPSMIKDAREKLEHLGISKDHIFFEQY